jgi:hypothetical protein
LLASITIAKKVVALQAKVASAPPAQKAAVIAKV